MQKLDDRSMPVINLGWEPGTKGYHLYSPHEKWVYVGKDVTFEEEKSWPWENKDEHELTQMSFPVAAETEGEVEEEHDPVTPLSHSSDSSGLNAENYDDSTVPRRTRLLSDVYNDTEETVFDE